MRTITARPFVKHDLSVLYKAYEDGSFDMPQAGRLYFAGVMQGIVERSYEVLMIEVNSVPIAFVAAGFDGWRYEPHVEFFNGVSVRSILEATTWFFEYLKTRSELGVIVVRALEESTNYFNHVCRYGHLEYVGKITKGDRRGDEYIYSASRDA